MTDNLYEKLSNERKKLQETGEMQDWWSTPSWQLFKSKYLYAAKTPKEQYKRIASTLAQYVEGHYPDWWPEGQTWEQAFFNEMWNGNLSGSTPVISNAGTDRGLSVSCSGNVVPNSIVGIYDAKREVAVLTKNGFGTASYLGAIQPRGSKTSKGVMSSGVVPIIEGFVKDMGYVAQGSARRGAWAGYLPIEHGDFFELVTYLKDAPDGLNIGWNISQNFVERLDAGDEDAIARFQAALTTKMITGRGYFFFIDKVNARRPQMYVDKGLDVKAAQLCVAPETLILTNQGHKRISDLADQQVSVWNGKEWSEVTIKKTSDRSELLKVTLSDGKSIECTPYHHFYLVGQKVVAAEDLKVGDKLVKLKTEVMGGDLELEKAYANGFYSGDGCTVEGKARVYLYNKKRLLRHLFEDTYGEYEQETRTYFYVKGLKEKFFVPDAGYSVRSRLDWFAGYLDADGAVTRNGKDECIQVGSVEPEFIRKVQLMLQTLGVQSKVSNMHLAARRMLPANDGTGELKEYDCRQCERLLISGKGLETLLGLGMQTHRLVLNPGILLRDCSHFVKAASVERTGRHDATYCFTEPKQGKGVFNGIILGNCAEITLHSSQDLSYTCVLSSMNAARTDEWIDTKAVFIATVFLDCVAEDFIRKAQGVPGLEKTLLSTQLGRPLGLGVCGFHTYLQKNMLPFESNEAYAFNTKLFKHIQEESLAASQWMAKALGEPEWCKGYGVRNTHRTAVAPTKSSALLMAGVSEGINPDPAMTFLQLTPAGEIDRANPVLLELMKAKGVYDKAHMEELTTAQGSVQGVDWLTEEEKEVFKTAFEIRQEVVVKLAASRQRFLCQTASTNLFFSAEEDEEYIAAVHAEAFRHPMILSLYYCYSKAGVPASNGVCESCQ